MFYTTDISVTLWIVNKNKNECYINLNSDHRNYRNRKEEILFMDLRQCGEPFEKKFIQFSKEDIQRFAETLHQWRSKVGNYKDTPEYSYSAKLEEIRKKDYSLVPSKYIEFINRDENINYNDKMSTLKVQFSELLKSEKQSREDLLEVFKNLGYEIEL